MPILEDAYADTASKMFSQKEYVIGRKFVKLDCTGWKGSNLRSMSMSMSMSMLETSFTTTTAATSNESNNLSKTYTLWNSLSL